MLIFFGHGQRVHGLLGKPLHQRVHLLLFVRDIFYRVRVGERMPPRLHGACPATGHHLLSVCCVWSNVFHLFLFPIFLSGVTQRVRCVARINPSFALGILESFLTAWRSCGRSRFALPKNQVVILILEFVQSPFGVENILG